jgi:hypothetical protein
MPNTTRHGQLTCSSRSAPARHTAWPPGPRTPRPWGAADRAWRRTQSAATASWVGAACAPSGGQGGCAQKAQWRYGKGSPTGRASHAHWHSTGKRACARAGGVTPLRKATHQHSPPCRGKCPHNPQRRGVRRLQLQQGPRSHQWPPVLSVLRHHQHTRRVHLKRP